MDPHNQRGAIGPIVGLVVILGIILAGGVYFYSKVQADKKYVDSLTQPTQTTPTMKEREPDTVTQISTQSTSSATADIQGDLNMFDAGDIDSVGNDIN